MPWDLGGQSAMLPADEYLGFRRARVRVAQGKLEQVASGLSPERDLAESCFAHGTRTQADELEPTPHAAAGGTHAPESWEWTPSNSSSACLA